MALTRRGGRDKNHAMTRTRNHYQDLGLEPPNRVFFFSFSFFFLQFHLLLYFSGHGPVAGFLGNFSGYENFCLMKFRWVYIFVDFENK